MQLHTTDDIINDLGSIVSKDNFVPEITPNLKKFANISQEIKACLEEKQNKNKYYADKRLRKTAQYKPADRVWVATHPISNLKKNITSKFTPHCDGPYLIVSQRSSTSYTIASIKNSSHMRNYHVSLLSPDIGKETESHNQVRSRGR